MASVSRGLVLALDLLRAPVLAETMRRQPLLPSHEILILLRIAGGCPETSDRAVRATGAPLDHLRQAASLYLKRVLLFPEADSYRVLGVSPESPHETVREHLRWMMRWLHPDRNRDNWETVYVDRVLSAWEDLKSPATRKQYDRRRAADSQAGAGMRHSRSWNPGVPWIAASIGQQKRNGRWPDVFRIGFGQDKEANHPSRRSDSAGKGWRRLAYIPLIGILSFLAWQVIVTHWPGEGGRGITAGGDTTSLMRLAEIHIADAQGEVDWPEVRRMGRRALHANPLETRALMLLAFAAEAEGDKRQAARLVSVAGARTLRDPRSHLWLFDLRLREGDFAGARAMAENG